MSAVPTTSANLPSPASIIEAMVRPDWVTYFMGMVFYVAMRSPDSQTKQGCVIVDWPTKVILGTGLNGHPRGSDGLPTYREGSTLPDGTIQGKPDKYNFMIHADANAVANTQGRSDDAWVFLPMQPCEMCLGLMLNMPFVKVTRIVYYEERDYGNINAIMGSLRGRSIELRSYDSLVNGANRVVETLAQAAEYVNLRDKHSAALSVASTKTYR